MLDVNSAALASLAQDVARRTAKGARKSSNRAINRSRLLAMIARDGKRCTSCHGLKSAADFAACEMRLDGLQTECRTCMKLRTAICKYGPVSAWHAVRDALRAQVTGAKPAQ